MHAAITGASSGIGEALAEELSRAGYRLTLVARRVDLLESLASRLKTDVMTFKADLSNLDEADAWVGPAQERFGSIEVLINNAGVQIVDNAVNIDNARAEAMLRLDYMAPLRIIRRVIPGMIARKSGVIVNVASMAALTQTPGMADYCGAKAALAQFSETLREEVASKGVRVLTVYPGPVRSAMETAAREKLKSKMADNVPTGEPQELARLVREAFEDDAPRVIYPGVYSVAYWFRASTQWLTHRLTPRIE